MPLSTTSNLNPLHSKASICSHTTLHPFLFASILNMVTHLAAVATAKGQPFEVQARATPKPGPGELLVAVKSVAINPADGHMRELGLFISKYPTVIGFDMAGLVLEVGDGVPTDAGADDSLPSFQPGITRVAVFTASFWREWGPDYGAFQESCLVPWQHAVILPNDISWNHAATLPVSIEVPLNAWDVLGIPRIDSVDTSTRASVGNSGKKEALLIWGASSSVGSMGVQTARLLREDPGSAFAAVYATAGSANQDYVASLGADRVFDYKSTDVVDSIVAAAKKDGLLIRHCFLATGQLSSCQAVLKAFIGDGLAGSSPTAAKIASAPVIPTDAAAVKGVETIFALPSMVESERLEQFRYWIGTFLGTNLVKGVIRPSPKPTVVGRGLSFINSGVDKILQGVSCTKLVVELAE
jgi:NADPH:quinone reductase-like Zn-dependent oxidoreductase